MFGKKSTDLTSKDAVEKSRAVYNGIAAGKVKDATKALDQAHGRKPKG